MSRARAARAALLPALAALVAFPPRPAAAFERTRGDACQTCLYWPALQGSSGAPWRLEYLVHSAGSRSTSCAGVLALSAIQAGFAVWTGATRTGESAPCTNYDVAYGGRTDDARVGLDGRNVVVFRGGPCQGRIPPSDACWSDPGSCADRYGCWEGDPAALATTVVTHHPVSGFIYDADIELNDWGGFAGSLPSLSGGGFPADGWYFTCDPPPGGTSVPPLCAAYGQTDCAYADLQNTIAHEAGHFLGLAHPVAGSQAVTMWRYADLREVTKRDLEPDDVAGVCAIYPVGGEPTSCTGLDTAQCQTSGCGCRSGGGAGALAVAALLLLLRPRRRRA